MFGITIFIIALMLIIVNYVYNNNDGNHSSQIIYKPGFVPGPLARNLSLAIYLGLQLPVGSSGSCGGLPAGRFPSRSLGGSPPPCSRQGLPSVRVTVHRCGLLPHSFHPCRFDAEASPGGIVSVALSLGSPPAAVSGCPSLCCPDFPPPYT